MSPSERIAKVETHISNIKEDVSEIKEMLSDHVVWENEKYDNLEKKFAAKWVESLLIFLFRGIALTLITTILTNHTM